jgi:predicted ATPase
LTALTNTANLARTEPVVYVMEDVHWIDEVSESLMADVLAVTAQTPTMVVITYRPEYQGALSRVHGAQTIALTPLTDSETSSLIGELLGPDPSVGGLASTVVSRFGGNPFFAEEWCASSPSGACSTVSVVAPSACGRRRCECARHRAGYHRRTH